MATRVSPPDLNQDYGENVAPPPQVGTGAAMVQAAYVTIGNDANLTLERALTAGTNITITDGGANSTVTINSTGGPAQFPLFGTAQDSAVVLDGVNTFSWATLTAGNLYTMNDAVMASTITLNAGIDLQPMGFTIFTTGTFTINGTVTAIGLTATAAGGAGAVVTNYVAGNWMVTTGASNQAGGAGGTGAGGVGALPAPNPLVRGMGGSGGAGGAGTVGAAAAGGTAQRPTITLGGVRFQSTIFMMQAPIYLSTSAGFGGAGGGGGGGNGVNAAGGGGAGGGVMGISAYAIAGSGTISVKGGGGKVGSAANCGGGGGGGGGLLRMITTTTNWQSVVTVDVSGGAPGAASGGGAAGTQGSTGTIIQYIVAP